MSDFPAIKYHEEAPEVFQAILNVETVLGQQGLDKTLFHLIKLRASQINQCAYCVDMHLREARRDGETDVRLDRLVVWRHVEDFSAKEKAILALVEDLTVLDHKAGYGAHRENLRTYFSEKEISVILEVIAMINLWNRLQVAQH
ncbi:MAG: carboxymuconolactone decarboxylase family protein [Methyloligellaceae bacterium]